jgi:hypothetical protein
MLLAFFNKTPKYAIRFDTKNDGLARHQRITSKKLWNDYNFEELWL